MPYEMLRNQTLAQTGPIVKNEPEREGHISRELNLMEAAIDELDAKLKVFVTKVASVMDNSRGTQAPSEKCPQQVFQTPLAERIHQQRQKVDELIEALKAAIERVEL